jgi:hypothetical protein
MVQETSKLIFMFCMYGQNCIYKIFNGYKYNYIGLTEFFLMDSVNVQIYKIDIGKLIFVKKIYWYLIEILRKLFFTCNPHFAPPLFSD